MSKRKKLTTDFNEEVKLNVGDEFSGVFVEGRDVQVDDDMRKIFTFTNADGKDVDIWGTGQLKQYMAKVKPGQKVFIKRTEDVPSPTFKNTMMKTYDVEVEL